MLKRLLSAVLLLRISQRSTVMALASRLRCALLLSAICLSLLASHEGAVGHSAVSLTFLRLVVQALWTFTLLYQGKCLVVIVALEKLLNTGALKLGLVLEHLLGVCIFPLTVGVLGVKIVFSEGWHERCLHALFTKGVPVETGEPLVLLEDVGALLAETIARLALNQSVDEVGGLH